MNRAALSAALATAVLLSGWPGSQAAEFAGRVGLYDLQKIAKEANLGLRPRKVGKSAGDREGQGQASREGKGKRRENPPMDNNLPPGKEGEEIVKTEIQKLVKELERKGLSEEQRKKLESQLKQQRANLSRLRSSQARDNRADDAVQKQVNAAITDHAKEQGFIAIFEKTFWDQNNHRKAVVVNGDPVDVTEAIVRRLKAKAGAAPTGELKEPKKEKAGAKL